MTRRHTAGLILAALALTLGACAPGTPSAAPAWHEPVASGAGGGGAAPTPSTSPSSTPGRPAPSSSPTAKPPAKPPTTKPAHGHGPYGVLTTTGTRSVALTFDDGPGPDTDEMLELLARYHIKATFCLIGKQVAGYAADIRRMVADGHTLCNHTWDHDEDLEKHSPGYIRNELTMTNDVIHTIVPGAKIQYFRNPGGEFSAQTVAIARGLGMKSLMWSVDPSDWKRPGTQAIINNVNAHTRPGSIVLSHDGGGDRSQTLAAYQQLIPGLKSRFKLIPMPVS